MNQNKELSNRFSKVEWATIGETELSSYCSGETDHLKSERSFQLWEFLKSCDISEGSKNRSHFELSKGKDNKMMVPSIVYSSKKLSEKNNGLTCQEVLSVE